MNNPCDTCLVKPSCNKWKHCDLWYEYEKNISFEFLLKELKLKCKKEENNG